MCHRRRGLLGILFFTGCNSRVCPPLGPLTSPSTRPLFLTRLSQAISPRPAALVHEGPRLRDAEPASSGSMRAS
ncbi:hypothetical protein V8C40DRAFT_236368 [Trichoderma camerunense]